MTRTPTRYRYSTAYKALCILLNVYCVSILADHFATLPYFASPTFCGIVTFKMGTDATEHNTFRLIRKAGSSYIYIYLTKTKPLSL